MTTPYEKIRRAVRLLVAAALLSYGAGATADIGVARLKVNLRQAPDLNSRIVAVLEPGVQARIMELVPDSEFVRVRRLRDGREGYLRLRNLDVRAERPAPPQDATIPPIPDPHRFEFDLAGRRDN